jgi:hypothetical protein
VRIAILTSPRSGSTSLFKLIEEHLIKEDYISISEPFTYYFKVRKYSNPDIFKDKHNVFIKTFIGDKHIPKFFKNDVDLYWNWFFNYFEKIIILDRKNKQLQSESLTYQLKKKNYENWHKKNYYDLTNITKEDIEHTKNILIKDSEQKHIISNKGYPIFYFEDIYIKKDRKIIDFLFKYINLNLNEALYEKYIISDTFKVRVEDNYEKNKLI